MNIIKGEQGLLDLFNKVNHEKVNPTLVDNSDINMSMPPNPNWGWELDASNKLSINPQLKKLNKEIDLLQMQKCSDQNQKDSIQEILDTRLKLGLMCINYPKNSEERKEEINILTSLNEQLKAYQNSLNKQLQTHQKSNSEIVTTNDHTETKNRNNSLIKNLAKKIRVSFSAISATRITPFGTSGGTTQTR